MHKIFSMLRGFKVKNIIFFGYDQDKDQTLIEQSNHRMEHYSGNGYGQGEDAFLNGDGSWQSSRHRLDEANA